MFLERLNHALQLYLDHQVKFIIFAGGVGARDAFAESRVAGQYVLDHGVTADDLFCEMRSRTT